MGIALFFLLSSMTSSNNSKDQAVINAVTASMIVMQLLITVAIVYPFTFNMMVTFSMTVNFSRIVIANNDSPKL